MRFHELEGDQRRQLINAQQAFTVWREADREFRHSYRGSMRWKKINGAEYLYRVYARMESSLGRRSSETEQIKAAYMEQRARLRQRTTTLRQRLDRMALVNRAQGIGRVPNLAAKIIRKLDEAQLLGVKAFVVGTHALYAYECRAGIQFDSVLTATDDLDLLWDAKRKLTFALFDERADGVIGLLRQIDRSFDARSGHFRAQNDDGFMVDFIRPERRNEMYKADPPLTGADAMAPAAIAGLQWLMSAPKFEQIAIGEDGQPLWMCCVDPRVFALHKFWVSKRDDREPVKKRRDAEQARAVATVASEYLSMDFQAKDLSVLPIDLTRAAKDLVANVRRNRSG